MSDTDGSKTQKLPKRTAKTATGRSLGLLPENEAFLEGVIDNLPVAIFAKDASDEFRFVLW
ncbi:MAG: hypothetical protein KDN20_08755, partial [Verrucomicrobiae bacterium]|nr:hypothetical protein [Verrucomicrobiae bacterium]